MQAIPSNNPSGNGKGGRARPENRAAAVISAGRGVMKLYLVSGLIIVALMLLAGLIMRAAQATWLTLTPDWFYAILTLHGAGMIVALAVCAMGALWFLIRRHVEFNAPVAALAWVLIMLGVVGVIVATLFGRFGGLYTFLFPLPFHGSWPNWATGVFLIAMMLVNAGWMIWSAQMLGGVLRAFGGFRGALGWDYVWHKQAFQAAERQPPPPEALPAFMVGFDGLVAGMAATLLGVALLVRWMDPRVILDPLWAKNLTYFWAHTFANLIIYMLAALIYVGLPYATRRTYHTSTVLVVGWWTSMVLTMTNYFHHLYMDFAQPGILQYFGELSSYLSA
ncbi:MAG: cbb3-type cytochrome c oxidase subunit I, partial [Limisphaerales bacterium]